MTARPDFGPLDGPEDEAAYELAIRCAFDAPTNLVKPWWDKIGRDKLRVVRADGKTVGGLIRIPMGQFFGGRSVPMGGIASVAILPEARGGGVARQLMVDALKDMHKERFALSTLFASTAALYRSVGFEQAGTYTVASTHPRELRRVKSDMVSRPLVDSDARVVEELYRTFAKTRDGFLDRDATMWSRVREPRGLVGRGYAIEDPDSGNLEGYVYLHTPGQLEWERLLIGDWAATTPRGYEGVLSFLSGHTTLWKQLAWKAGPYDPLVASLPHPSVEIGLQDYWYVRIVDVVRALTARGYPLGASGEVHFDISDAVLAENHGRFVLEVKEGRADVRRGGDGHLSLGIGALAPLYTGLVSAEDLVLRGRARGDQDTLATATRLFLSRGPTSADQF